MIGTQKYSVVIYFHFLRLYQSILMSFHVLLKNHKQGIALEVMEFSFLIFWLRKHESRKVG